MKVPKRRTCFAVIATAVSVAAPASAQSSAAQDADSICVAMQHAVGRGLQPDSAPRPTELVLPPLPAPSSTRRRTYTVAVWVNAEGRPTVDSIRTTPELQPLSYRRRTEKAIARMKFRPAELAGCAVPGWYQWQLRLE